MQIYKSIVTKDETVKLFKFDIWRLNLQSFYLYIKFLIDLTKKELSKFCPFLFDFSSLHSKLCSVLCKTDLKKSSIIHRFDLSLHQIVISILKPLPPPLPLSFRKVIGHILMYMPFITYCLFFFITFVSRSSSVNYPF